MFSGTELIIFKGQKSHNDKEVLKAQEFIENNYLDKITVDELSEKVAVSRRTFERRFKKVERRFQRNQNRWKRVRGTRKQPRIPEELKRKL